MGEDREKDLTLRGQFTKSQDKRRVPEIVCKILRAKPRKRILWGGKSVAKKDRVKRPGRVMTGGKIGGVLEFEMWGKASRRMAKPRDVIRRWGVLKRKPRNGRGCPRKEKVGGVSGKRKFVGHAGLNRDRPNEGQS